MGVWASSGLFAAEGLSGLQVCLPLQVPSLPAVAVLPQYRLRSALFNTFQGRSAPIPPVSKSFHRSPQSIPFFLGPLCHPSTSSRPPPPAMDLLADSDASVSSDEDSGALRTPIRSQLRLGHQLQLPSLSGRPIGDDISWKASRSVRVAALQCASTGLDRHQWGLWYGDGLASLGADIGLLSETGLCTEAQHSLACQGLSAKGFCAVSHGRPATASQTYRAGVLLAVRTGYSGQWSQVAKDTAGRALAATLLTATGLAVRLVVVHAPVGACSPGFSHSPLAPAEADLKLFVDAQIRLCAANSMALILGGDLNSFASVDLDTWQGTYVDSSTCLAAHLGNQGLLDTFRARHPNLKAYTTRTQTPLAGWMPSGGSPRQTKRPKFSMPLPSGSGSVE